MNKITIKIPGFTIEKTIGHGGMSIVYLARDLKLDRLVAVKVLHPHLLTKNTIAERFRREAMATAKLNHPNIVHIYDYVLMNNQPVIIMEYVIGDNLEERIKQSNKVFDFKTTLFIMRQVASALQVTHTENIIHRDIKPSNIMLSNDNRVLLTDFGLAHQIQDVHLTSDDMIAGTPGFMSPEQISGNKISLNTDIYSWAVTFYYLLSGKLPYRDTEFSHIVSDISSGSVDISAILPAIKSNLFYKFLEKCLSKKPVNRFANAIELLKEMDSIMCTSDSSPAFNELFISTKRNEPPSSLSVIAKTQIMRNNNANYKKAVLFASIFIVFGLFIYGVYISFSEKKNKNNSIQTKLEIKTPIRKDSITNFSKSIKLKKIDKRRKKFKIKSTNIVVDSGQFFVAVKPWAEIVINGKSYGKTPLKRPIVLVSGKHNIVFKNEFCLPLKDTINITANKILRKRYKLSIKPAYQ